MRFPYFVPFAAAAFVVACNDSLVAPDTLDPHRTGTGGKEALAVTQTAEGLRERRIEYDWTAERYVKEIHVGSDMHLISERDRVQILPGETVWVLFQVDAQRRLEGEGTVKGVRGQTCVTNTASSRVGGFAVVERVEEWTGGEWTAVTGATAVLSSSEPLDAGMSQCLPYEILFDAKSAGNYRVVATVSSTQGRTMAQATAGFTPPNEARAVEIDAHASVRDNWWAACRAAFGLDFSCMSPDTFPRDRLLEVDAAGRASVSFMVDVRNDGVCDETFILTIDEPLREGGPAPSGGELRPVSGSLTITTGRCEELESCPQSAEWWAARFASNPQEVLSLIPIALGTVHGAKTVGVATEDLVRGVFARFGDPTNGIVELYAQLFTAKLNIRIGADPRPTRDVRLAADVFLAEHRATEWTTLSAAERALVFELAAALEAFNERGCPPAGGNGEACTRTIGYWKNHAGFGPQADVVTPLLPVWLGTAGGTKSVQVTTAASAVALLDKSGDASNGVNKLYAQLLAAKLNIKNGAEGSAVLQTITAADAFLALNSAGDWSALSPAQRQHVLGWASILDDYNNGRIGPGHCS